MLEPHVSNFLLLVLSQAVIKCGWGGGGNKAELNMYQIRNRCRNIDRNKLAPAMGRKDKHDVTSYWRDTERILEQNYGKIILSQRGDTNKNREYRIILGPQDNLHRLLKGTGPG